MFIILCYGWFNCLEMEVDIKWKSISIFAFYIWNLIISQLN